MLLGSLCQLDFEYAQKYKSQGSPCCGAALHVSNFKRNPRGIGVDILEDLEGYELEWELRYSFCCSKCRKRFTPASFRFLGRKHYWGWLLLIQCALAGGVFAQQQLKKKLQAYQIGLDQRTLERWLAWWESVVGNSPFWKSFKGRFMAPIDPKYIPAGLLCRIFERAKEDLQMTLTEVLGHLRPLTGHLINPANGP